MPPARLAGAISIAPAFFYVAFYIFHFLFVLIFRQRLDFDLAGVLVLGLGIGIVPQGPRQVTAVFLLFYPLLDWRSRIFLALSTTPLRMLSSEMYAVWAYIIR